MADVTERDMVRLPQKNTYNVRIHYTRPNKQNEACTQTVKVFRIEQKGFIKMAHRCCQHLKRD